MSAHICPSGNGRPCPRARHCVENGACHFNTAEGTAPEAPARRAPPVRFEPDYGGVRVVLPWYQRVPPMKLFVAVGAAGGLAIGLYRHFF
jgi:hypothetical protein